jgi:hypothetical protein
MLPRVGENDARSTALSVELFLQRFRSSVDVLITALGTSDAVSLVPDVNRICDEVVANATTSMQVTKTMVATCEMIEKATTASQPSVFLARIQRMGDNDSATPYYSRMTKSDARYAIRHLPRLVTGKFGLFGTSPLLRKVISRIDELLNTDGTDVVPSIVESAIQNLRRLAVNRKTVFQIDGDLVSPIIDWQQLASADRLIDGFRLKEHELNESLPCSSSTILGRIWLEFFGTVVIPYDPVARKESLKHFFQRADMQRHLQHWESVIANAISKVNKH